ncbi:hypothetical protein JTE90_026834 [Oedothorax gibbosus]|uniref:Uncharacterized protein n=1 Tax=Oedothorax gibbosus TaxID=931172 RepID=A0AAV6V5B8_9ARAC|nr:hypothetical protein JTE90_026834 [Oedothorax gibbosus]
MEDPFYKIHSSNTVYPKDLSNLFDESLMDMDLPYLQKKALDIVIEVSQQEADALAKATVKQAVYFVAPVSFGKSDCLKLQGCLLYVS